jgi:uroporphyrinogen decarboxylase
VTVHICGNTTNRLDKIPESGADIMSVDYKVNLSEARRILGGKLAFEGVEAASRECIKQAGEGGGYILMPGCDIPPSVPIENVKAMVEAAHGYLE